MSDQTISESGDEINYFQISFRRVDSRFLTDLRINYENIDSKYRLSYNKQVNLFPVTTDSEILLKQIKILSLIMMC